MKHNIKRALGEHSMGIAVHAVAQDTGDLEETWKNRSLHNDSLFLTGILSHARSIVSFTKGSTFLSKA